MWTTNFVQRSYLFSLDSHHVPSATNYSLSCHNYSLWSCKALGMYLRSNFWPRENDVNSGAIYYEQYADYECLPRPRRTLCGLRA